MFVSGGVIVPPPQSLVFQIPHVRCLDGMFLGSSHTSPGVWKPRELLDTVLRSEETPDSPHRGFRLFSFEWI